MNPETKDFLKERRIYRIIDYLNESAYLSDKEIDENEDYTTFFEHIYTYLENKNLEKFYFEIVSNYISTCCYKLKFININELIEHLDLFALNTNDFQITKEEIEKLKASLKISKTKRLTSN